MGSEEMSEGKIEVLGEAGKDARGRRLLHVRCFCGVEKTVVRKSFLGNATKSCGCVRVERVREASTTHGHRAKDGQTPEYEAWRTMIARCYREEVRSYPYYGGKGIGVCPAWRDSFDAFLADVGKRPDEGHVLGLLDKSRDFGPGNVAWVTRHDDDRMKRSNTFYEVGGVSKCLVDWASEHGIPKSTLHYRVVTRGMSMRDALDVGRGCSGRVLP